MHMIVFQYNSRTNVAMSTKLSAQPINYPAQNTEVRDKILR